MHTSSNDDIFASILALVSSLPYKSMHGSGFYHAIDIRLQACDDSSCHLSIAVLLEVKGTKYSSW